MSVVNIHCNKTDNPVFVGHNAYVFEDSFKNKLTKNFGVFLTWEVS